MKILIVRLSALGDIILTLPILEVLRQKYPHPQKLEIDWAVSEEGKAILENHPLIHTLYVLPKFRLKNFAGLLKQFNKIKAEQYDIVIDCQGLLKSAVVTAFSGAKTRVGFKNARELAWLAYTHKVDYAPLINHTKPFHDSLFALSDVIGCARPTTPTYPLSFESRIFCGTGSAPQGESIIIAIAPFTKWKSKDWPIEHWQTLIQKITAESNAEVWVLGSKQDTENPNFKSLLKVNNKVKALNKPISELIPAIKAVSILIAGDSFPIHLAGAVGIPHVFGLYGPTSSLRTHPPLWKSNFTAIPHSLESLSCQPCHNKACHVSGHPCMTQILPEAVWSHIQPLIKQDVTV